MNQCYILKLCRNQLNISLHQTITTRFKLQGTRNPVTSSDTVWTESKDILKCCVEKLYGHFDASSIFMWRLVQSPPFYQEPWFCMPPSAEKQETSSMHGETTENMYLPTYNLLSYCQRLHLHCTTVGLVHFFFTFFFVTSNIKTSTTTSSWSNSIHKAIFARQWRGRNRLRSVK